MKKFFLLSALAFGAVCAQAANFSDYFKVSFHGTELKNGDSIIVNPEVFADDPDFEFGCFYTGDVEVETVSGEPQALYAEFEYDTPSGPVIKSDYAAWGAVTLCYQNAAEGGSCLGNGDDRVAGHAVLTCKGSGEANAMKLMCDAAGTAKENKITAKLNLIAMENGEEIEDADFTVVVTFQSENSAVEGVEAEDAAPEYYSLQGMRVMNPEKGIYIVKKGAKVYKQVIR